MEPVRGAGEWRGLHLLLSASNFAQGLGAFSVLGLLPVIGQDMRLAAHETGWLMSLYALVYAVSSPVLISTFGHKDRKPLLTAGLALLAAGAAGAALASSLGGMLVARAVMAVGGGLITPVVSSLAVVTSTPSTRGRALSVVFAGLPLSQAVGVPLGTWLAGMVSWRATFWLVAGVAALALLAVARMAPSGVRVQPVSLRSLSAVMTELRAMLAVSFIVFFIGANFVLLTYLAPFFTDRFDLTSAQIATILAIYGAAAFFGNAVGGAMTDRLGPVRTLEVLCVVTMLVLPVITLVDLPLTAVLVLLVIWALFGWSVHAAQQARLAHLDPQRAPILLSLHSAALYVGSSLGAAIGGQVLLHADAHWLGVAGVLPTAAALATLAAARRLERGRSV